MRRFILLGIILIIVCSSARYAKDPPANTYENLYKSNIIALRKEFIKLSEVIKKTDPTDSIARKSVYNQLYICREALKKTDFWTRYLDENLYWSLNGPLPVEWE